MCLCKLCVRHGFIINWAVLSNLLCDRSISKTLVCNETTIVLNFCFLILLCWAKAIAAAIRLAGSFGHTGICSRVQMTSADDIVIVGVKLTGPQHEVFVQKRQCGVDFGGGDDDNARPPEARPRDSDYVPLEMF